MIIQSAIEFIRDQINSYLQVKLGISTDAVVINNVILEDGSPGSSELCLSLIRVEEEKVHKAQSPYRKYSSGTSDSIDLVNPDIKLNLYLLVSAHFGDNNYDQALLYLSHVITFFQGKQVFNHQNSPALDPDIEKLISELHTLTFEQQNYIWACMGANYVPSVVYKLRLLSIADDSMLQELGTVTEIGTNLSRS